MLFNCNFLTAAAAAALAVPAGAQVADVDAGVEAQVQAGAAGVEGEVKTEASTEANVGAVTQAQPEASAAAGTEAQAEAQAQPGGAGEVVLATAADIRAGVLVQDPQGGAVGTVEAVEADGAVVTTGTVRAKLPFESFGKNDRGLVISMTRAEFEAAVSAQQSGS